METKVIKGKFHFKRRRFVFIDNEIKRCRLLEGKLRVVKYQGNTYVVLPIGGKVSDGLLIPIVEDYDSL